MSAYTPQSPIAGPSQGSAAAWHAWAERQGAHRLPELRRYLDTIYRFAPQVGLAAHVLVCQSVHECTDPETGVPWASEAWSETLNPAGIGVTRDELRTWHDFARGDWAALAHLVRVSQYVLGTVPTTLWEYQYLDPRGAVPAAIRGNRRTLESFGHPDWRNHPTWATDGTYGEKWARTLNRLASVYTTTPPAVDGTGGAIPGGTDMATHRFVLNAGHRNINRGGASREIDWTYPMTKKLQQAIHRRGGTAWITSEEDNDNDPSYSHSLGLQGAARIAVDIANRVGGIDAYISMHYEGTAASARGFFGIFPDSVQGGVDVRANNPLDVQLCRVIAEHVTRTGMPKRTGWVVEPGVMSERQTGVGGQGYRLGEFVGTIGIRDRTARVILEGGNYVNTTDRAMLWSATWQDAYAEAIVDGLEEVFGAFPKTEQPVPPPDHEPVPQYAEAKPIAELADGRPFLAVSNGATLVRADLLVKATKATPRLQYATTGAKTIGPDIKAGELFSVAYLIVNPDGSLYWYTPWHTRVRFEDTEIVEATEPIAEDIAA